MTMEQYTYIEQSKVQLMLCVFDPKGDYPGEKMCAGPLCMGWVHEMDETGKRIIECFNDRGSVEDYCGIIPLGLK